MHFSRGHNLALTRLLPAALVLFSASSLICLGQDKPTLTTSGQIRSLSIEEARAHLKIHVTGQVMVMSGWKRSFFFRDSSGGISVDREDNGPKLEAGDQVELEGESAPGLFAPVINATKVSVIGRRPLPPAKLRRYEELVGGQQDSQWISVRGVVLSASITPSWGRPVLIMEMNIGSGNISVRVQDFSGTDPKSLVDSQVEVQGVCATNFNERRQFVGLRMFVQDLSDVQILRAAVSDPFQLTTQTVDSVMSFASGAGASHRIKIKGTVTYQEPGRSLYLEDGGQGIYVESEQTSVATPGDEVEVVGFGSMGPYSPMLSSGLFRVVGKGLPPRPIHLRAAEVISTRSDGFLSAPYDGSLVTIRGTLMERLARADEENLLLVDGVTPFRARLRLVGGAEDRLPEKGSVVELTGVCAIRTGQDREPKAFELQLRSLDDVRVIKNPPWLNARNAAAVVGLSMLAMFGAGFWLYSLRRQVRRQTAVIQSQVEELKSSQLQLVSNARLSALGMMAGGIAHEINNPLAIMHASASDLLELAEGGEVSQAVLLKKSGKIRETAERIGRIVKGLRHIGREGSDDPMQSTKVNLLVEQVLDLCRERFRSHGIRLISPGIDPHLSVVCREVQISQVLLNLLQNAFDATIDTAGEKWVRVEVSPSRDHVALKVLDSGPGVPEPIRMRIMEPFFTTKPVGKGTGLGLSISRSIVEQHGGKLEVDGGERSAFVVTLPTQGANASDSEGRDDSSGG